MKDYNEKVKSVQDKVANAETIISGTKEELGKVRDDLRSAELNVSDISRTVDAINLEMIDKVSKTEFDLTEAAVKRHETEIKQNAELISQRVTNEQFSEATERISKNESLIEQTAEEIKSKVSSKEVREEIEKIDKYNPNLLRNTRDWLDFWSIKNGNAMISSDTYRNCHIQIVEANNVGYETVAEDLSIGKTYAVSVWAKADNLNAELWLITGNGEYRMEMSDGDQTVTNEFVRYKALVVASKNAETIKFVFRNLTGRGYFASAKMELGTTLSGWQPHHEDVYQRIISNESEIKQTSELIQQNVKSIKEQGEKLTAQESQIKQTSESIDSLVSNVEKQGESITEAMSSIEQNAKEITSKVSATQVGELIEDINLDNSNRVLNSDFARDWEDWYAVSSQFIITTIASQKMAKVTRTGLSADSNIYIATNYFPAKDKERIMFGFDFWAENIVALDSKNIAVLELFDAKDIRVDQKVINTNSFPAIKSNEIYRINSSYVIDRSDVSKARLRFQLGRNGSIAFGKIMAQSGSIKSTEWSPNPKDAEILHLKQESKIEQTARDITLAVEKAEAIDKKVDYNTSQIKLWPEKIQSTVTEVKNYTDEKDKENRKFTESQITQESGKITESITKYVNQEVGSARTYAKTEIEKTAEGISQTVQNVKRSSEQYADSKVNELDFSDRNLLPQSDFKDLDAVEKWAADGVIKEWGTVNSMRIVFTKGSLNRVYSRLNILSNLNIGDKYSVSFKAFSNFNSEIKIGGWGDLSAPITINTRGTDYQDKIYTVEGLTRGTSPTLSIVGNNTNPDFVLQITDIMVVKGNKARPHQLAPEDYQNLDINERNYAQDTLFQNGLWKFTNEHSSETGIIKGDVASLTGVQNGKWKQWQIYSNQGATALLEIKENETYTLSMEARVVTGSKEDGVAGMFLRMNRKDGTSVNPIAMRLNGLTSEWQKFYVTKTIPGNGYLNNFVLWRILVDYTGIGTFEFRRVKLQKGNRATDWTPAIEDISQSVVEYTKSEIKQTSDSITQTVTKLTETVNNIGSPGVNLLMNGGFENGNIGWTNIREFHTLAHSGEKAIISRNWGEWATVQRNLISVVPGRKYEISYWYVTSSDANGTANLQKLRIGKKEGDLIESYGWDGATVNQNTWTQMSRIWTCPSNVYEIKVSMHFNNTIGWVKVDDISMVDVTDREALVGRANIFKDSKFESSFAGFMEGTGWSTNNTTGPGRVWSNNTGSRNRFYFSTQESVVLGQGRYYDIKFKANIGAKAFDLEVGTAAGENLIFPIEANSPNNWYTGTIYTTRNLALSFWMDSGTSFRIHELYVYESTTGITNKRIEMAESKIAQTEKDITASVKTSKEYADDEIEKIKNGGRNLIRNSARPFTLVASSTSTHTYKVIYEGLKKSTTYTFSSKVTFLTGSSDVITIYPYLGNGNNMHNIQVPVVDGKISATFTTDDRFEYNLLVYAGKAGLTNNNQVKFEEYQLEEGNKATNWSPALEDPMYYAYADDIQGKINFTTVYPNPNMLKSDYLIPNGITNLRINEGVYTFSVPSGSGGWGYGLRISRSVIDEPMLIPWGKKAFISFEVKTPKAMGVNVDVNTYPITGTGDSWNANDNDLSSSRSGTKATTKANTWTKMSVSYINSDPRNSGKVDLYDASTIGVVSSSETATIDNIQIRNIKFEVGESSQAEATAYITHADEDPVNSFMKYTGTSRVGGDDPSVYDWQPTRVTTAEFKEAMLGINEDSIWGMVSNTQEYREFRENALTEDDIEDVRDNAEKAYNELYATDSGVISRIGKFEQTATEWGTSLEDITKRIVDGEVITDHVNHFMRFQRTSDNDPNAFMSIGTNADSMEVRISRNRISFLDGGVEVAYFSNQQMYIRRGIMTESLEVGDHRIESLGNGSTIIGFTGGGNLLVNGSFEEGKNGWIGIREIHTVGKDGSCIIDRGWAQPVAQASPIKMYASETYRVSFWYQTSSDANGTTSNQKLRFGRPDGTLVTAFGWDGASTTWTQFTRNWSPSQDEEIVVSCQFNHSVGWVKFDNIEIINIKDL